MDNIITDMKMIIYDVNNIAPRTNAFLSKKLGLNILGMSRRDYITYNFMKLDSDNYMSTDKSNVVVLPNYEYNNINDRSEFYKYYHDIFNIKMKDLTKYIYNIISQQNNKIIRQCELSKILNLGSILDKNYDFTNNITQLMEDSSMVKRISENNKTLIKIYNSLEYNPREYINDIKIYASQYEAYIASFLENKNYEYIYQYKFKDCKDKKCLPFDFLIKYNNTDILLEYDGMQHNYPISIFGGEEAFIIRKKHDEIKNKYCKDNNIPLLRINKIKKKDIDNEINIFLENYN